ncbi:sensor histidine kinase [Pseudooceanicola sp. 502str34]
MSFDQNGLEQSLGFAGFGRWEIEPATGSMSFDEQCRAFFGVTAEEAQSKDAVISRLHPEDRAQVASALKNVRSIGDVFDETFRLNLPNGRQRWIRGIGQLGLHSGLPRILGVSMDVTEELELRMQRQLHLDEMNHRIKNLFALVSSMVSSAGRESQSKEELVENLRGRISALDRAHSMMLRTDTSKPLPLRELIDNVLAPARSDQSIISQGEDVMVPAEAVTSFVLIIHEWVTNSTKYGALKHCEGELEIAWAVVDGVLELIWREKVADYDFNAEKGFGSRLLQACASQLGAEKQRCFDNGLLTIRLKFPIGE